MFLMVPTLHSVKVQIHNSYVFPRQVFLELATPKRTSPSALDVKRIWTSRNELLAAFKISSESMNKAYKLRGLILLHALYRMCVGWSDFHVFIYFIWSFFSKYSTRIYNLWVCTMYIRLLLLSTMMSVDQ